LVLEGDNMDRNNFRKNFRNEDDMFRYMQSIHELHEQIHDVLQVVVANSDTKVSKKPSSHMLPGGIGYSLRSKTNERLVYVGTTYTGSIDLLIFIVDDIKIAQNILIQNKKDFVRTSEKGIQWGELHFVFNLDEAKYFNLPVEQQRKMINDWITDRLTDTDITKR
jgi:hypothetical protein